MSRIGNFWNKTKQNIQNRVERIRNFPDRMIERAVHAILENIPDNVAEKFDDLAAEQERKFEEQTAKLDASIAAFRREMQAAMAQFEAAIENLAKELRGIVMVPQIIKNGTPAIEFKSFVYVPMTDSDEYVSAEGAEGVVVGEGIHAQVGTYVAHVLGHQLVADAAANAVAHFAYACLLAL